jgi:hypothetical protein
MTVIIRTYVGPTSERKNPLVSPPGAAATPNSHKEAPLQISKRFHTITSPSAHVRQPQPISSLASTVRNCIFFCHHRCRAGFCVCSKQQNLVRPPVRRCSLGVYLVDCCDLELPRFVTLRAFVVSRPPMCCFGAPVHPQRTPTTPHG